MAQAVQSVGIRTSALVEPTQKNTYAVIRMVNHQTESSADDKPVVFGSYLQVDYFTNSDANIGAVSIIQAARNAGFVYRGRSDDYQNNRQHIAIRFMKLEGSDNE